MSDDNHHSSLLRPPTKVVVAQAPDPYWNIQVCPTCGGGGDIPSGVSYMGQSEWVGCDECYGIGYLNERILEILEQLENVI